MQVHAFVRPSRKRESLGWDGRQLVVDVQAPPVEGAANVRLAEMLANWLRLGKSRVVVVKGWTARNKILEIEIDPAVFQTAIETLPRVPRQDELL